MDSVTTFGLEEFISHCSLQIAIETGRQSLTSHIKTIIQLKFSTAEEEIQENIKLTEGNLGS